MYTKSTLPDCSEHKVKIGAQSGGMFQISVVAVGQRDGTVSSTVTRLVLLQTNSNLEVDLQDDQYLQQANNSHQTQLHCVLTVSVW